MKATIETIKVEKPIACLIHESTKSCIPVYTPIGLFKRIMLYFCFGLKYKKYENAREIVFWRK